MQYDITIKGLTPLICHNGQGIDPFTEINIERSKLTRKKASNRTQEEEARIRQLECLGSLYLSDDGKRASFPAAGIRSCIEAAARKLRQGPMVREGLIVLGTTMYYDVDKCGRNPEELSLKTQFTVPVVVQRNRILRTRARFDKWSIAFRIDTDETLVDGKKLSAWLDIAGRRIGLGDWRPQKSGQFGRFETESIMAVINATPPDNG